jgi:hypothetical protein
MKFKMHLNLAWLVPVLALGLAQVPTAYAGTGNEEEAAQDAEEAEAQAAQDEEDAAAQAAQDEEDAIIEENALIEAENALFDAEAAAYIAEMNALAADALAAVEAGVFTPEEAAAIEEYVAMWDADVAAFEAEQAEVDAHNAGVDIWEADVAVEREAAEAMEAMIAAELAEEVALNDLTENAVDEAAHGGGAPPPEAVAAAGVLEAKLVAQREKPSPAPDAVPAAEAPTVFGDTEDARVVIVAKAETWVVITDQAGKTVFTQIVKPGDRFLVPNQEGLVMMTGDGGALFFLVDGNSVASVGAQGKMLVNASLSPKALISGKVGAPEELLVEALEDVAKEPNRIMTLELR